MEVKFLSKKIIKINKINKAKCPICKKIVVEPYIPFCSMKCSDIDLMKWLTDEKENSTSNEYNFLSQ